MDLNNQQGPVLGQEFNGSPQNKKLGAFDVDFDQANRLGAVSETFIQSCHRNRKRYAIRIILVHAGGQAHSILYPCNSRVPPATSEAALEIRVIRLPKIIERDMSFKQAVIGRHRFERINNGRTDARRNSRKRGCDNQSLHQHRPHSHRGATSHA